MSRRTPYLIFFAILLVAIPLDAIQLGDTEFQTVARYGTPQVANEAAGTATYRWSAWQIDILYEDVVINTLIYTKAKPLSDVEIRTLLSQNHGIYPWTPTAFNGSRPIAWVRPDGATATFDPAHDHRLVLKAVPTPTPVLVIRAEATPTPAPKPSVAPAATPEIANPIPLPFAAVQATPTPKPATSTPAPAPPVARRAAPTPTPKPRVSFVSMLISPLAIGAVILLLVVIVALKKFRLRPQASKTVVVPIQDYPFAVGSRGKFRVRPDAPPSLETLTWRNFELLMAEVFRRRGFLVASAPVRSADSAVDLRLSRDDFHLLAQCKRWASGKVNVQGILEFHNAIQAEKAEGGIFISTGTFSDESRAFAAQRKIELLDADGVREIIAAATVPGENIFEKEQWGPLGPLRHV